MNIPKLVHRIEIQAQRLSRQSSPAEIEHSIRYHLYLFVFYSQHFVHHGI